MALDRAALRRRYREERDKRLRPDGVHQYLRMSGDYARYLDDPYSRPNARAPRTDHVTVAVVGGGFAGLVAGARLKQAGIEKIRIIDKAGAFGGTWYWNRYPGAQCDTASYVYLPLLEETGYMPTEKYAHAPEILAHCERIGRHFGLYDDALFHTEVVDLAWHGGQWTVRTDRGDHFTARFIVLGIGSLHVPKLPGIPGIRSFQGHSFHTSRWDYTYTGGDPNGRPMDRLADRRVAVIGSGASAVQCVPRLSKACEQLYVFQRTPAAVDVRNNQPTDPQWYQQIATPGWQQRWMENFTSSQTGVFPDEDLVMDGWTDIARRARSKAMGLPLEEQTPANVAAALEDADNERMAEIRARVDAVVHDPATAEKLKAWYRQICKRPCFHDEYLQSYNEPGTHLVDTDGRGVDRITETGVLAAGRHYEVDCIVFATGFEVATEYVTRAGFDVTGRAGIRLSAHWTEGMRSLHGIHVRGFPNAFLIQPVQGANFSTNVPHNLVEAADTVATVIQYTVQKGCTEVEVSASAEQAWLDLLPSGRGPQRLADCTPGTNNNEGQETAARRVGYPRGAASFFRHLGQWRSAGTFEGLEFR